MLKEINKKYYLSASLICADMLDLKTSIQNLEKGKIDMIHFDVMDGHFVPRLGLHPEMLVQIKSITRLPVSVHFMIDNPEQFVSIYAKSGADTIIVPVEGNCHLHRTLKMIKDLGVKVGVALNPATPLNVLDYILLDIDYILLMAINPGIVGHPIIPQVLNKISDLRDKVKNYDIKIEIDGGVTFESAPQLLKKGADILVCGSGTIFKKDILVDEKITELKTVLDKI